VDEGRAGRVAAPGWRAHAARRSFAEPCALECGGRLARRRPAWQLLGCRYEQATVLAWHGGEREQLEALAIAETTRCHGDSELAAAATRVRGVRRIPRGSRSSTEDTHKAHASRGRGAASVVEGLANSAIATRLFVSTRPSTIMSRRSWRSWACHRGPGGRDGTQPSLTRILSAGLARRAQRDRLDLQQSTRPRPLSNSLTLVTAAGPAAGAQTPAIP